jgi:hypothetical protein
MPHGVSLARLLAAASFVGLVAGCGGVAATGDLDRIQVTLSQFDIAVTNTSGGPLNDVVAEIKPAGPGSHYVARLGTVSNNEQRRVGHANFSDRDSVPFSLRNAKPTRVIVSGTTVDGKPLRIDVPFKL